MERDCSGETKSRSSSSRTRIEMVNREMEALKVEEDMYVRVRGEAAQRRSLDEVVVNYAK